MHTAQGMLPLFGDPPRRPPAGPGSPSPLPPRDYQEEMIGKLMTAPGRGVQRPLSVLPTGGGKTICFAHLLHRRDGRALVMAHRDELIGQARGKLALVSGRQDIGVVKAQQDDWGADWIVGSVQTLCRPGRVERILQAGPVATVVVDEAHHAVTRTYLDVLSRLGCLDEGTQVLTAGFTATAMRSDGVGLKAVWQEIVQTRGLLQMIAEGYLVDIRGEQIGSDFNLGNVRTSHGDYTDSSLGDELERSGALEAAVRAYTQHAAGRLAVAFCPTIATAHALAAEFTAAGIPSEAVDGTMPMDQRRDVLARLHCGDLRVVPNCAVLTEGWDEPAVSCCLLLRPTRSPVFFVQMAGRVLRPFTGMLAGERYEKTDAVLLDISGSAAEHKICTLATLAGMDPGAVKPGESVMEAAEREQYQVALGAAHSRRIELLRRSELRWIPVDAAADAPAGWVLPAGKGSRMILVPAGADPMADEWLVWEDSGGTGLRQASAAVLTMEWARGVAEERARAWPEFSRSDAAWRSGRPSEQQRAKAERMRIKLPAGDLTRGQVSDLIDAQGAKWTIEKIRRQAQAAR
jgi:superfamily II DNA or RNA helicase